MNAPINTTLDALDALTRLQSKLAFVAFAVGEFGVYPPDNSVAFGASLILDDLAELAAALEKALAALQ